MDTPPTQAELDQQYRDAQEFAAIARAEADSFNFAELFNGRHRVKKAKRSSRKSEFILRTKPVTESE